jgi:hypothetical protein
MMHGRHALLLLALLLVPTLAGALTPAELCEAGKLKLAGKYGFCRLKAAAKSVKSGVAADYSACDEKLSGKWAPLESAAGGQCPSNGDTGAVQAFVTQHTDDLAVALAGASLPDCPADLATCNADLDACQSQPAGGRVRSGQGVCFDDTGAQIGCAGTGQDGELQLGLAPNVVDNGDGTLTDLNTGLMWEKLGDDDSVHDKDLTYTWLTAFSAKIAALNAAQFAGYADWRLPNVNELQSVMNYGVAAPAIDAAFNVACAPGCTEVTCSCTVPASAWSSTSVYGSGATAWSASFLNGEIAPGAKSKTFSVRAVRGGS